MDSPLWATCPVNKTVNFTQFFDSKKFRFSVFKNGKKGKRGRSGGQDSKGYRDYNFNDKNLLLFFAIKRVFWYCSL